MPDKISEAKVLSILSNFKESISEYEIIDMEKYKGWSSEYLFLLVSSDDNYILKGKNAEQLDGYDNEVKVTQALLANSIESRKPILTKYNEIFYKDENLYWSLMTYIPGAPAHVNEYNEATVKSLAEHIEQYIVSSINISELRNLELKPPLKQNSSKVIEQFKDSTDFLETKNIIKKTDITIMYKTLTEGRANYLDKLEEQCLIHNDINPRNILIDHSTKNVIALIDWDHVKYGNPLKDISDAIAIFYDFLNLQKATEFKNLFYKSLSSNLLKKISKDTFDFAFLFYYTIAKWRAILFYKDLLIKYGNQYGEEQRFLTEMKQNYAKWIEIASTFNS